MAYITPDLPPKRRTQRVTLDITVNVYEYDLPESWGWPNLLDMSPEDVTVVEFGPVIDGNI